MRPTIIIVIALLMLKKDSESVRLLEMRVPAHAAIGGEALLGCQFDMEGDQLYSVKWYKDGREFYRYVPRNDPTFYYFTTPGAVVDIPRSTGNVVVLTDLTEQSAGLYRCEVSGEAPRFATVFDQKYITIYLLPGHGPQITGLQNEYKVGDRVTVNCTSSASRPEAQLKWLVNDKPVPSKELRGPWYRLSVSQPNATVTVLQLRYTVKPKHFVDGHMKLKCQAIIAPLYQQDQQQTARKYLPEELQFHQEDQINTFPQMTFDQFELPSATSPAPHTYAGLEDEQDQASMIHKSQHMLFLTGLLLVVLNA